MQKLKNIEFLRIFLIFGIVLLHMFIDRKWCFCNLFPDIVLYSNIKTAVAHSNNGVEGFFIIAGFLLFITFKTKMSIWDFIKKKYIRLSPPIIFSILLCVFGYFLGAMHFKIIPNILTILLLNQFGIYFVDGQNPVLWFTSVLFAGLLVYFCILKWVPDNIKNKIILTLIIVSYTILEILQHGTFINPLKNYYYIFNIGFLRAIGGIGLGCLIGHYIKLYFSRIKDFILSKKQKLLVSSCELFLTSFLIWWMIFPHERINNIIFVLAFAILLILFILKKGYISEFFDKDIWVKLGKYQYSIYVVHYVVIRVLGLVLWKQHPEFVVSYPVIPILVTLVIIILVGVFTYHIVEEPCAKYLTNKFLPCKVKSKEN